MGTQITADAYRPPVSDADPAAAAEETAFTARVRKDHRIVIPDADRARLGVREGDLVSVRLRKVGRPQGAPP